MMDRVGDPQLSPDGRYALFSVRATDYAANKGVTSLYVVDLNKPPQPVMVVEKGSSPAGRRTAGRSITRPRRKVRRRSGTALSMPTIPARAWH